MASSTSLDFLLTWTVYHTFLESGKEFIEKIKTNKYDLILIDEELSQIDTNKLIIKLKEIKKLNPPIVLLTKDNSYEYNKEYLNNGFAGYILKPIKKDIVLNNIHKFIQTKN